MRKWIAAGIAAMLLLGVAGAVCANMRRPELFDSPARQAVHQADSKTSELTSRETAQAPSGFTAENKAVRRVHLTADYPQIKGLPDQAAEERINQDLEGIIRAYSERMSTNDKLTLGYEITSRSGDFYSFVFRGKLTQGTHSDAKGETLPVLKALNYDAQTNVSITAVNLLKDDPASMSAFSKLFKVYAGKDARAFAKDMGVYFTDTDVVIYDLQQDAAPEYTQVHIPLKEAKPFFNDPIQPINQ
ncbi:hypothetical protein P9847_26780 [Paenibacillus chibensis]|uniref:DUF3298 domain-containing protein n=1 Tax=Paenibacillus chibensis TaxID=59846 RepID=A0ABU6Q177_9BACL|nr:hypothetical protein [Paenibacillus chibensis]